MDKDQRNAKQFTNHHAQLDTLKNNLVLISEYFYIHVNIHNINPIVLTGKYVGETECEKLPVEICGAGCTTEEG